MSIQRFSGYTLSQAGLQAGLLAGVLAVGVATSACSSSTLGTLGQVLGSAVGGQGTATNGQIAGQVRSVNTQQRYIQVVTTSGESGSVYYDQNTVVVYQQQQYPVTSLEQGDRITMQVQQTNQNQLYVSRIDVTQSVQQTNGGSVYGNTNGSNQVIQLSGTVRNMDLQRGTFQLQTRTYGTVVVTLPYNPPQATYDYFSKLRNGNTVRLEGTSIGNNRFEIYRFL